jgi:Mitochondrial branched-chain alpha-ketoacid dehydrogenase kinase
VGQYAKKPLNLITLDSLLRMGKDRNISDIAVYVHEELPPRLARRIVAIQKLPYIVGVNPYITEVCDLYRHSFHRILETPAPTDEESNALFTKNLAELFHSHQNVIPNLARGFMECGKYMSGEGAKNFLDEMIRARIGIRGSNDSR